MSSFSTKVKDFFGFIDEDSDPVAIEGPAQSAPAPLPTTPAKRPFKGSLIHTKSSSFTYNEIKVEEPRIYEDSLAIAATLREHKPVIVNLKYLDETTSKRLIDFICGTAYAINGHMLKIGESIFLFTPANVKIDHNSNSQISPTETVTPQPTPPASESHSFLVR